MAGWIGFCLMEVVGGGGGEMGGEGVNPLGSDVGDPFVLLNQTVNPKEGLRRNQ
jgi:hypothetical protein